MSVSISPGQALLLWQKVNLNLVLDEAPDLSVRQIAILMTVYIDAPPHTIRGLAKKLNVTKPVITRALDAMGIKGLIARRRDEKDKRNVLIQRTVKGSLYLEALGDMISQTAIDMKDH